MKGLLLFTIVLFATVAIEGHGNGWCRGPRSHLNRRFDVGYALRFDGNDFVELPSLSIGGALTFEFLIKVTSGQSGPIVSFGPANNNIEISLDNNKKLTFSASKPGNGNSISTTTAQSSSISRDGWQYFVVTVDNNKRVSFFTAEDNGNPSQLGGTTTLSFLPALSTRTPGYIGRSAKSPNSYVTADLDEIRIWSRVLPSSEMDRDRDIPDGDSTLIAWWNFNQGLGIIATDVSFQGRDGTLGGNNYSATPEWIVSQFTRSRTCMIYRDVSLKTYDRKCFRIPFNYIGDLWLTNSDNQQIAIQVRVQQKPGNSGAGTVVQQLAFQTSQTVYKWDLDFASKSDSFFYVNNTRINLVNFEDPFTGVSVYKTYTGNAQHQYDVSLPLFQMKIEAYPNDRWTDVTVRIPLSNKDSVDGLCGDFDGIEGDDDDNVIKATWPVATGQSLFQGPVNLTSVQDTPCTFVTGSQLETDANTICNNAALIAPYLKVQCLNDICKAGDIGAASSSADITFQDCVDDSENSTVFCRPPCPNFCSLHGTCQTSGNCQCTSPWSGADCSQRPNFQCFQATWGNNQRQIFSFKGTPSAIDHYSYSKDYPFSSASGKEISDTANLYLYNEMSTNFLSLIHLNDKARDNTGGRVKATYSVRSNDNPSIKVFDDPSYVDDTYTSINSGNFTANWQWWGCCTDGLVLEVLRGASVPNFCVSVNLTRYEGINQVVVSSENNYGSADVIRLDSDRLSICGTTCNNTCGTYSNCGSCTSDPKCGWCVETDTCELGTGGGPDRGRCNLWRFSNKVNVPRVVRTQVDFPIDPSAATIFLPTGQTAKADFFVFVPSPENLALDIVLSLDVTKYFGNDLAYIQSATTAVFTSMNTYYPQSRLGITSFSDTPFQPLGSPSQGDFAYQENLRLTNNLAYIQNILNSIVPRDGGDAQNSQLTALYNAARSTNLNWRSGAMKLIVVITKSGFHVPPTSNLPNGAPEYPTPTAVRDALLSANIVPIFVVPTTLQTQYQSLVSSWGFGYVRGISAISAANIFTGVQETVSLLSTSIRAISLPSTSNNVNAIYPPQGYIGVSAGTRVVFTATLSQTIAGGATIIVPGFGKVDFSFISSDLPSGAPQTIYALNGETSTIAQLYAYGYYGQSYPEITALPAPNVATLYQVLNGNQRGAQITTLPAVVTDQTYKVWVQFVNSGTTSFSYQVKDDCLACSPSNYSVSINFQTSNQAPTAVNPGPVTFAEDGNATILLSGTDAEDGSNVVAIISSFPTSGSLFQVSGALITPANPTVNAGNRVIFKSGPNEFGTGNNNLYASFNFVVRDSQGLQSASSLVTVYVTPVNDAPVANAQNVNAQEDTPQSITLVATDVEGNSLTYFIAAIPAITTGYLSNVAGGAALAVNAQLTGATVWFNPVSNYFGSTSFSFYARDASSSSNIASVSINVASVNDAPVASSQTFPGTEDQDLTFVLPGYDIDTADASLRGYICAWNGVGTLKQFSGAVIAPGSVDVLVTDNQRRVTYVPPANAFSGSLPFTSFTFKLFDGSLFSSCAVASVTIQGVPDAPTASGPSQVYTNESTPVTITISGQDVDLTQVSFKLCLAPTGGVLRNGATVLAAQQNFTGQFSPPDLTFTSVTYTPSIGANGVAYDSFSFQTYDGVNFSSCFFVTINVNPVNDPPVVRNDTITTQEDIELTYLLTATDDGGNANVNFDITRLPSRGRLLQGSDRTPITAVGTRVANKNVIFVPALNDNGVPYDSFDFVGVDSSLLVSAPATITVSVTKVNDRPVAYPFTVSFTDVTSIFINQFSGFDVEDGSNVTVRIKSLPTSGSLFVCQISNDANCSTTAAVAGSLAPLNRVRFVPLPSIYGTYVVTFSYAVVDVETLESQPPVNATLNVTKSNNPPTVTPTASPVTALVGDYTILQVSFSDPDAFQTVSLLVDPTATVGSLFQCISSVNICDPGAPITLADTPVTDNQGRVVYLAVDDSGSKSTDNTTVAFKAVDSLSLSSLVTVSIVLRQKIVPLTALTTSLSFSEKTTSVSFTLAVNTTGLSNSNITYTIVTLPSVGSLQQSDGTPITTPNTNVTNGGNLIFVKPNSFDNGANYDQFNWNALASNGAKLGTPATVIVSVAAVNDPPQAILYNSPVFAEDTNGSLQLTAYDPDVFTNGDVLTFIVNIVPNKGALFYQMDANNVTNFAAGPLVNGQSVTNPWGLVWFVPPKDFYSRIGLPTVVFRYTVRDQFPVTSANLDVQITITSVNDVPIATSQSWQGVNNRDVTTVTFNNFFDVEVSQGLQTIYIQLVTLPNPTKGKLYVDAVMSGNEAAIGVNYTSTQFKFLTAQPGATGVNFASFQWRTSDGEDYSTTVTGQIDILYLNTPPTIFLPLSAQTVDEDTTVDFIFAASDPDVTDSVEMSVTTFPTHGTLLYYNSDSFAFELVDSTTRLFNLTTGRYLPNVGFNGVDTFVVSAIDLRLENPLDVSLIKPVISVTVRPINDPPTFTTTQSTILSGGYGTPAVCEGVRVLDDASEINGIVSVKILTVGAEKVKLTNAGALTGYNATANVKTLALTGTVDQFNAAFGAGIEFYPTTTDFTGTLTVLVNDNGNNDYRVSRPTYNATIGIDVQVDDNGSIGFSAGFIGVTSLMSAGVFGAYKFMKKKKLIPEEADPWENDELFDMTLDNPLYSGSNPSSLEPVFDSK